MNGLLGQKLGMTQVYDGNGHRVAVTVIAAGPCAVTQRKTREKDGYDAVQLGFGKQKPSRVSKPMLGKFEKVGVEPMRVLREFRVDGDEALKTGDEVNAAMFENVGLVSVSGVTKGRGFQGVVTRYRTKGGRKSHGGKGAHRRGGAIGQCAYPGRVKKGQKMPGHMGAVNITAQNLEIVNVDTEKNVILVKGAVPGPTGALVTVLISRKHVEPKS